MQESYPSDISRKQFEKIRAILENSRKKTKPRKLDLYEGTFKKVCQTEFLVQLNF